MWVCKNCGGKIRATVSRTVSKDHNIDSYGNPIGKCLRRTVGEVEAVNYYCSKCENWSSTDEDISRIGEFKEG